MAEVVLHERAGSRRRTICLAPEQPHPSTQEYDKHWNKSIAPLGPTGLLIEAALLHGIAIDDQLVVRQKAEQTIDIMKAPFQHLGALVRHLCIRNWTRSDEGCRMETENLKEMNRIATQAGAKGRDEDDQLMLDVVRTGSVWNRTAAFWAGQVDDNKCQHCMAEECSLNHIWTCAALAEARKEADKELAGIDPPRRSRFR